MPHALHSPPTSPVAALADQLWFSCPSCKGELKVPVALADTTGACPLCGEKVHIPATSETRGSPTWQGMEEASVADDAGLPADDPEVEGDVPRAFRGDLQFSSGATQPLTSKRGFFDTEVGLPSSEPPLPKVSLMERPHPKKAGNDGFATPLRKFSEPFAAPPPPPVATPPKAQEMAPPPAAPSPVVEAKVESPAIPVVSWEKESGLFKPLRKYPPKQRRRSDALVEALPVRAPVPVPVVPLPPVPAPVPMPVAETWVEKPLLPPPVVVQAPPVPVAPPVYVAPEAFKLVEIPAVVVQAPPALVVSPPPVEPEACVVVEIPSVVVFEEPVTACVEPEPEAMAEPASAVVPEPAQEPVMETLSPAAPPRKSIVLRAVERSVALRRQRESTNPPGWKRISRAQPLPPRQPAAPVIHAGQFAAPEPPVPTREPLPRLAEPKVVLAPPVPLPLVRAKSLAIPAAPVPAREPLPKQVVPQVEVAATVPMTAIAALASPAVAYASPTQEPEQPVHEVVPPPAEEEHLPLRIGGVVIPRYTLIPRGSQLQLWLRRAAVAMLCLLPFVLLSGLYMPYVRRITAWVEEMKRSRISLQDIQQQTTENRNNPSAKGLKKDALAALQQQWTKLTTPEKKPDTGHGSTRPVVFRSSSADLTTSNPETDWPQILLRNYGVFHGHSPMEGGSSFILEASDGSHWIATSAHLLGASGGVEPPVLPGKLVTDLDHWRAHLPDKPDTFAEVEGGRQLMSLITADWLAMRLSSNDAVLPVKPLRLRRSLLRPDETVYIVGLPYGDRTGAAQHVYQGQVTVTSPANPSQFAVLVQAGVDFSGFRGAPILDAEGEVVGVLTDRWSTLLLATRSELLAQLIEGK